MRTGGWNHLLSDEGSGFYIGMQLVKAVAEHIDARREDPVLYDLFTKETGITDLSGLDILVLENALVRSGISKLAPLAEAAAQAGSAVPHSPGLC